MFQLSHRWQIIQPFVKRMVGASKFDDRVKREAEDRAIDEAFNSPGGMTAGSYENLLLRARFMEAAVEIAAEINISVESLGVVFDRVMTTGTKKGAEREKYIHRQVDVDEEMFNIGSDLKGDDGSIHGISLKLNESEGVMIFIVREIGQGLPAICDDPAADRSKVVSTDTKNWYTDKGFRLTETQHFASAFSDRMGVSRHEMDIYLNACKTYAKRGTRPVCQTGGCYLGLFGVRPTGEELSELDILVYNFARHQVRLYDLKEVYTDGTRFQPIGCQTLRTP
jgi:hypothetical protein